MRGLQAGTRWSPTGDGDPDGADPTGVQSRARRAAPAVGRVLIVATLIAMAAVPLIQALAVPGMVATRAAGDSPFLLQRVHEYAAGLSAGQLPPRWMPGAAYGLGYPFFNFYAPLAYAFAAALAVAGGGVVGAIKVTQLVAFIAAATGMYLAARTLWGTRAAGFAAAAAYTFAPYHLVNVYVRGDALSELLAYGVFPWTIFAFERAIRRRTTSTLAFFALTVAVLLLSHNVSALLFGLMLGGYVVWRFIGLLVAFAAPALTSAAPGLASAAPDLTSAAPAPPTAAPDLTSAAPGLTSAAAPHVGSPNVSEAGEPPGASPVSSAHSIHSDSPTYSASPVSSAHSIPQMNPPALLHKGILALERLTWGARWPSVVSSIVVAIVGLGLGLVLSAWFWAPALAERDAVSVDENLTGYFSYDARGPDGELLHFRTTDVVSSDFVMDYSVASGCSSCQTGLVQLIVALLGAAAAITWWRAGYGDQGRELGRDLPQPPVGPLQVLSLAVVAAVATSGMLTPLSLPVWENAPLLPFAQFPWRWLAPQAAALALLTGGLGLGSWRWLAAAVATFALGLAATLGVEVEPMAISAVTDSDLAAYEVITTNIGSTVRAEYLPEAVQPRPWSGPAAITGGTGEPRATAGNLESATATHRSAGEEDWLVEVSGPVTATVAFPTMWFPGWEAELEPSQTPAQANEHRYIRTEAAPGLGWISVPIPPGEWVLRLHLGRTPIRAWTEGLALLALVTVLALFLADRRRSWWKYLLGAIVGFVLSVVLAAVMPVGAERGPITLDTGRTPYPHRNPDGIRFGESTLRTALVEPKVAMAGRNLTLSMEWADPWAGSMVEVDLVSPAEPVYHVPDVKSHVEANQASASRLNVPIPEETASGLYFLRLRVTNNGRPVATRSAAGYSLGSVYLGPIRVAGQERFRDVPPEPVARMGPLTLHAVQASPSAADPSLLETRLYWEAGRPANINFKTSVRIIRPGADADAEDVVLAQEDKQPLYGFYPTTSWMPGGQVLDIRWVPIPEDLEARDDYIVEVHLYDEHTGQVAGIGRVSEVAIRPPPPDEPPDDQGRDSGEPDAGRGGGGQDAAARDRTDDSDQEDAPGEPLRDDAAEDGATD